MKNKSFKLVGFFLCVSAFAETTVERVSATFSRGTRPGIAVSLQDKYLVIAKKNANERPSRIGKTELTLLSTGADTDFPNYEVAKVSKVVLTSLPGPRDEPIPSQLSGILPNGKTFEVTLKAMSHTEEVKPDGTLLQTYCGVNEQAGIPEDSNVAKVCLESTEAKEIK